MTKERRNTSPDRTSLIDLSYRERKTDVCEERKERDLKICKKPATNDNQDSPITRLLPSSAQPMISNKKL